MRKLLIMICLQFALTSHSNPVNEIVKALKTGNASLLSKNFDNSIELTLDYKTASYSREQAELILKNFFYMNNIKDYIPLSVVTNTTWQYYRGTLFTANGNYQVSILIKQTGGRQIIQKLSFDK